MVALVPSAFANENPDQTSRKRIVAIDVGHSKKAPGAISATGNPEYEFNLRIAKRLHSAFSASKQIRSVIISSPKEMSLIDRTRLAAAQGADLFISIHHDSAQAKYMKTWVVGGRKLKYTDRFEGYGVFVSGKNPQFDESFDLARSIGKRISARGVKFSPHHAEPVPGENRQIIDRDAGVYRYDDLIVLRTAKMPAVLVECGVIANPAEEKLLLTPEHQEAIATAIMQGVIDYFDNSPH